MPSLSRYAWRAVVLCLCAALSPAQTDPVITTIAGSSFLFDGDGRPALEAQLSQMFHVIVDPQGGVIVADRANHQVVRIAPSGILTVVAGNGILGFSGDGGPATSASMAFPNAIALDLAGNLYIAESINARIRRVRPNGIIDTFAGSGVRGFAGDGGPATQAAFGNPRGLALDRAGNLYVSDSVTHRVRRIAPDGIVSTFAGTGQPGFSGDGGPATSAALNSPWHVSIDSGGGVLIADTTNNRIRRVDLQGIITTVAGSGSPVQSGDGGEARLAGLTGPTSAVADSSGTIYIGGLFERIRAVGPDGMIRTFAGTQVAGFSGDEGPVGRAELNGPIGLAVDETGNLYIGDSVNLRVRRVNPQGVVQTIGGTGQFRNSGDGGPAVAASFGILDGLATDAEGNTYVADSINHRVRRIGADGRIVTVAGTGLAGFTGDGGPAIAATLNSPRGVALDRDGNLYIADRINVRVRRVSRDGIISTFAGGAGPDRLNAPDGSAATNVRMFPERLSVDSAGNVFVLDYVLCLVYRIDTRRMVTRHAGQFLRCGSTGDGGPARDALIRPTGSLFGGDIATDLSGNLFLAEPNPGEGNTAGRVRRIDTAGGMSAFAGSGAAGVPADSAQAAQAPLFNPYSVAADSGGRVLIGDALNVFAVRDGRISVLAGATGASGLGDGGPARAARVRTVVAIAADRAGNVLFNDSGTTRIRAILARPPAASASPLELRLEAQAGGAISPPRTIVLSSNVAGIAYQARVSDGAQWLRLSPSAGSAPSLIEVSADPAGLASGTFTANITLSTPLADPASRTIAVTLEVSPAVTAKLELDKESLSFTFPRDAAPRSQPVVVRNTGSGGLGFRAEASTVSGGPWLTVTPVSGTATPSAGVTLAVAANPAGLPPGTYSGRVTVTGAGQSKSVVVNMTISANDRALLLSQSGLTFTAVAGGGVVPPRSFEVLNIGRGVLRWSATATTLEGGSQWLSVSPPSGSTDAAASTVPEVRVSVSQNGLSPGVYYGLVRLDASDAANSPQLVTVFLEVLPAGADPGALVDPAELVFTSSVGRSPGSKEALVYNVAREPKNYRSLASLTGATLVNLPGDALLAIDRPNRVIVQPFVEGLGPGVHIGNVNLQFSDGRVRGIRVRLILTAEPRTARAADACAPTRLVPALTSVSQSLAITAGWPVPLTAEVRDDCGNPHENGSVVVSFTNGDPPVSLQALSNGRWAGTWPSRSASASETSVKVEASNTQATLTGDQTLVVGIRARQDPPVIGAVVSAAGFQPFVPIAPSAMITIFGERLSEATQAATAFPLPARIGSTRLLIGGRELALLYVSPTQINAIVPTGLESNTRHQLLVQRANTYAQPLPIDVAPAQPAVFPGAVGAPGGVIVVYATGLGATSPAIATGERTPPALVPVRDEVKATIGGIESRVEYAGLAPGFAGLYQINLRAPAALGQGTFPLIVAVSGQTSPPAQVVLR